MSTLCIYHGGCTDGMASAYAVHKADPDAEFFPGVYQQDPPWPLIESASDVLFVDFAYKAPVLREVVRRCPGRVTVLDHHETARDDLLPMLESGEIGGEFDMDRCGALIAWDRLLGPESRPPLLAHIDARDRWTDARPDGNDEVIIALRSYPHTYAALPDWAPLMAFDGVRKLRAEGVAIQRYYRARVEELKAQASWWTLGSLRMPMVNAPYAFCSEVAGELAEVNDGVAACWFVTADGSITVSMRARKGGDFHAGRFCETFAGGGGHAGAAGFSVPASRVDLAARHVLPAGEAQAAA